MWNKLPFDLLAKIFSFLSPDSLACAMSACRHWHTCTKYMGPLVKRRCSQHQAWFIAMPMRTRLGQSCCYAYNPIDGHWHKLSLEFLPTMVRPVAAMNGLILLRPTTTISLQLALCNPFTRHFRGLKLPNILRTNPAVGVVELHPTQHYPYPNFKIYVAGGLSEAPGGGASYEPTLEMYDSQRDTWTIIGCMPVEFAVRLTVWTPNENVYLNGVLYWMTSARAYNVMGFEIGTKKWRELSVPMSDTLEFGALVPRGGKLTLVGGISGGGACVWELDENDNWGMVEKLPFEMGIRFLGDKRSWDSTRCVGMDGAVCLYRELSSGLVVWREVVDKARWEWAWVEGGCSIKGKKIENFPIKGLLIQPRVSPFCPLKD